MRDIRASAVSIKELLLFFAPLGASASLVIISHVIINATLSRSVEPEFIISAYAIALSLHTIFERPLVLLRQTCSALVRDKQSLRAVAVVGAYTMGGVLLLAAITAYSPLGAWIFRHAFEVEERMVSYTVQAFQIVILVTLFSGIRCLYHGVIISHFKTKWLTIGMVVRLFGMTALAVFFLKSGPITDARPGVIIFLFGMIIECAVSAWEGRKLVRNLPESKEGHEVNSKRHVVRFYRPLMFSSFIAVLIGPGVNIALGKTDNLTLAIASFTIAASVTQLVLSFFSYTHQIVLNYSGKAPLTVRRFVRVISVIPTLLLAIVTFTAPGTWFLEHVMGISGQLLEQTRIVLAVSLITVVIFPWLDYLNGWVMLHGQTGIMVKSQAANIITVVVVLIAALVLFPAWNGVIGALATSFGLLGELIVVALALRARRKALA